MAVKTQDFKITLAPFKSFQIPTIKKIKTDHELALDQFHEWIKSCKKIVVSDSKGDIIQTEYYFPDQIIIKKTINKT